MAENQSGADSGEGKEGNQTQTEGQEKKPTGQKQENAKESDKSQQGKKSSASKEELQVQLEQHKGTIAALTKKLDTMSGQFSKLGEAFGIKPAEGEKPTVEQILTEVTNRVEKLEQGEKRYQAVQVLDEVIDEFEEEGQPLPQNVKDYLRNELKGSINETDKAKVTELVTGKVGSIRELLKGANFSTPDKRPPAKTPANIEGLHRGMSANEILDKMDKGKKQ